MKYLATTLCVLLSGMTVVCGGARAASFNWQTSDSSLTLRNGDKTVWRLAQNEELDKEWKSFAM